MRDTEARIGSRFKNFKIFCQILPLESSGLVFSCIKARITIYRNHKMPVNYVLAGIMAFIFPFVDPVKNNFAGFLINRCSSILFSSADIHLTLCNICRSC